MDLKQFVKETISQVVSGVNEINEELNTTTGGYVQNKVTYPQPMNGFIRSYIRESIDVDFDVAITATESDGKNGSAGIKVASILNIGGGVDSKTENQIVSRVKFTLPLILPYLKNNDEDNE